MRPAFVCFAVWRWSTDTLGVAIGGVVLIPVIVGLVQFIKRLIPSAPDNLWLLLSFLLGILGQCVVWLIATGTAVASWTLEQWATLVVLGLAFGMASSKAWDEVKDRENALGRAVRGLGNQ